MDRSRYKILFIAFIIISQCIISAEAYGKPRITVIPFSARDISENDAYAITLFFETALQNTCAYEVIEQSRAEAILAAQEYVLSDCTDERCAVEIGRLLTAEQIVLGTIGRFAEAYYLNVKIVDVETGKNLGATKRQAPGLVGLGNLVDQLALELAGSMDEATFNEPEIIEQPSEDYIVETGPAGGLVFYDKGRYTNGWRYLEAAPVDTEWEDIEWESKKTSININGAERTAVGTGKKNTEDIIAYHGTGSTYAAQLCDGLICGGYNDWFLPSKDELNLMYTNLHEKGLGGFAPTDYWSSSEHNKKYAWQQYFYDGYQGCGSKYGNVRVRAVRAF